MVAFLLLSENLCVEEAASLTGRVDALLQRARARDADRASADDVVRPDEVVAIGDEVSVLDVVDERMIFRSLSLSRARFVLSSRPHACIPFVV